MGARGQQEIKSKRRKSEVRLNSERGSAFYPLGRSAEMTALDFFRFLVVPGNECHLDKT